MDFPDYDPRAFRVGLHRLFPKAGYIDLDAAAKWLNVSPRTIRNWINERSTTPRAAWYAVYLCSTGDLSLYSQKWHGWHIENDRLTNQRHQYGVGEIESIEWYRLTNARLLEQVRNLEAELHAKPISEKTVRQGVCRVKNEIISSLSVLEDELTIARSAALRANTG